MAKIQDKLYNRIIEGELLELTEEEKVKLGLGGGSKIYKHEISGVTSDVNARIIIYSTSNTVISDRFGLMYNTESFLQSCFVNNITSDQRNVETILGFIFSGSQYKLYYIHYDASTSTLKQTEMNTYDFTDTVTEL